MWSQQLHAFGFLPDAPLPSLPELGGSARANQGRVPPTTPHPPPHSRRLGAEISNSATSTEWRSQRIILNSKRTTSLGWICVQPSRCGSSILLPSNLSQNFIFPGCAPSDWMIGRLLSAEYKGGVQHGVFLAFLFSKKSPSVFFASYRRGRQSSGRNNSSGAACQR